MLETGERGQPGRRQDYGIDFALATTQCPPPPGSLPNYCQIKCSMLKKLLWQILCR